MNCPTGMTEGIAEIFSEAERPRAPPYMSEQSSNPLVLEQGLSIADAIAIDSPPRGRTVDCSMDVCSTSPQRTPTVLIAPPPCGYFSCREACGQHEKIEDFIHGSERCIDDFWQLLDDVLD
jgi:hypothetical protein